MVLEDEYGKGNLYLNKYKHIRHALNHPELDTDKFKQKLLNELGSYHIDPSSPKAKELVERNLLDLKHDATQIIEEILKTI